MTPTCRTVLFLLLACSVTARAQEIKYIDLSLAPQRAELRYPPAPQPDCEAGKPCTGGGYGGVGIADGGPDRRDPQALGVYLLRVTPTDIDPTKPFEAEFRILNTGIAPIEIPVSPHLADLQPSDESAAFSYFSLSLVVQVEGPQRGTPSVGFVQVYGATDHEGTMLMVRPGEWIRVRAKVTLRNWPEPASTRVRGEFWLRLNTFQPHPGGGFTKIENLYPNVTPTPWIDIRLLRAAPSDQPKW
jgi:hypothetical protein